MHVIIGGSGFIGTNLCRLLESSGANFCIIDLKPSPEFPNKTIIADIRDRDALHQAFMQAGEPEVIVLLAAVHRDDVSDRKEYYRTNVAGTENVCSVATDFGIERIVFTSTVAVYGFAPPQTSEEGSINPFNDYGRSKFEGEKVLDSWKNEIPETRSTCIVRPTVVFGEGNRGNVFNLLNQIASGKFLMIGNGKNTKSLAYVGNIVAFLNFCSRDKSVSGVFNYVDQPDYDMNSLVTHVRSVLTGKSSTGFRIPYLAGITLGKIADGVSRLVGKSLPISAIRVKKFCSETSFSSRAHGQAGFEAPFELSEGLRRTLVSEFLKPDPSRSIFYTE